MTSGRIPSSSLRRYWANPSGRAGMAALLALVLLLVIWWSVSQWYESRLLLEQRAEIVGEVSVRGNALSSAVNRRLARLQGLHAFVETEGDRPDFAASFDSFAARLYAGSRGIRNLAVAPDGMVKYTYPLAGNEAVLGYQPALDPRPEIRGDVEEAIATGEIVLSGPAELVQGGLGLIARQAVYIDGNYWGLVNIILDIPPLLAEAGVDLKTDQLDFALRDGQGRVFSGPDTLFDRAPIIAPVTLPEGYWELAGAPVAGWEAIIQEPLRIFKAAGLVIVFLLTVVIYLVVNRQRGLTMMVAQRTRELSAANARLEQRVAERTRELSSLLVFSREVASTLEPDPLFNRVMDQTASLLDCSGCAILTLEDNRFIVRSHFRQAAPGIRLWQNYSPDNPIGQMILEQRQPIIIDDVSADTPLALAFRQAAGLPAGGDRRVRSWMGIPLIARDRVIGLLTLYHTKPWKYAARDADLAMTLANQTAVAIENAWLYEKAQKLAVLQERQRLARELHDSVSQALYGIVLGAQTANDLLERDLQNDQQGTSLRGSIDYVLSLAKAGLAEMRSLIFELRPESLEAEGLVRALEKRAAALQARHAIQVSTMLGEEPAVPLPVKEALFRVAQEAFNNTVKHAGASRLSITLDEDEGWLVLEIADNGRGFDTQASFPGHLGLRTMRERVEQFEGDLTIDSAACRGTQVVARVPGHPLLKQKLSASNEIADNSANNKFFG